MVSLHTYVEQTRRVISEGRSSKTQKKIKSGMLLFSRSSFVGYYLAGEILVVSKLAINFTELFGIQHERSHCISNKKKLDEFVIRMDLEVNA